MATNYPHRDNDTLLSANNDFVQALGMENRPVVNGPRGGQHGWAPDIFRYVVESPHIQQQGYCILMSAPEFFNKLPGGTFLTSLLKSMMENRTESFEGVTRKMETEFAELKWAGRTMSVPVGGTISYGTPVHNLTDVEGEIYTKLIEIWTQYGMYDQTIGHAKLVTLDDPGDMLIDEIAASCCYLEPTKNCKDVSHACIAVAMMPKDTPQIEIRRNREEAGNLRKISQEFTALFEFDSLAAKQIARALLVRMPWYNPDGRAAPEGFKNRTAALESLVDVGTIEQMVEQSNLVENPLYMG